MRLTRLNSLDPCGFINIFAPIADFVSTSAPCAGGNPVLRCDAFQGQPCGFVFMSKMRIHLHRHAMNLVLFICSSYDDKLTQSSSFRTLNKCKHTNRHVRDFILLMAALERVINFRKRCTKGMKAAISFGWHTKRAVPRRVIQPMSATRNGIFAALTWS